MVKHGLAAGLDVTDERAAARGTSIKKDRIMGTGRIKLSLLLLAAIATVVACSSDSDDDGDDIGAGGASIGGQGAGAGGDSSTALGGSAPSGGSEEAAGHGGASTAGSTGGRAGAGGEAGLPGADAAGSGEGGAGAVGAGLGGLTASDGGSLSSGGSNEVQGGSGGSADGVGGRDNIGGAQSSSGGAGGGAAELTGGQGGYGGAVSEEGDAVIDISELGATCLDPSLVACIAGRARERARCFAETASWGLHDACPDGTVCYGATGVCVPEDSGCEVSHPEGTYCASEYELRTCRTGETLGAVELCDGQCSGNRCVESPLTCGDSMVSSWNDCNCSCANEVGDVCAGQGLCEGGFDGIGQVPVLMRTWGENAYEGYGSCADEPYYMMSGWDISALSGRWMAITGFGAAVGYIRNGNTMSERCELLLSSRRCVVAEDPERVIVSTRDAHQPRAVVLLRPAAEGEECAESDE